LYAATVYVKEHQRTSTNPLEWTMTTKHASALDNNQLDAQPFESQTVFDRRTFVVTSLATGFASAVVPVFAQAIKTDTKGIKAEEIKIATADGQMPAYYAKPDAKSENAGPFPIVLVVQEIFGVHEYIKDVCRRFAKAGYLAIAPELFARQGDPSKYTPETVQDLMKDVVRKVPDAQVMSDLDAVVKWATSKSANGDASKLAITGFCWGGRITWLYSAHNKSVKAGGAWYGRVVGTASELQPKHPIDIAEQVNGAVLGLYGEADNGIPFDTVVKMQDKLKAAKSKSEIILYDDMPHGFHADYRPSYRKEKAEEAWATLLSWFKKHGVS
jgi:carboxymethylenebutenolidase